MQGDAHDDESGFRQKITALQRFLNHGMSRFSLESWHVVLTSLFQAYQHVHKERPDDKVITKVTSVAQLRLISRDLLLHRGGLREVDAHALKHLDNFLAALRCLKEAKDSVDTLFQFLCTNYYDPPKQEDCSKEFTTVANQKLSHDLGTKSHGSVVGNNAHDSLSYQYGIQTPEQMSGNAAHKLHLTVIDMRDIVTRWAHLQEENDINIDDFDPESLQDLLLLQGTSAFEAVLRLLPDIFAKFYKCLELAKQWWLLAHQIYPVLPIYRPVPPVTSPSKDGTFDDEGSDGGDAQSAAASPVVVAKDDVSFQEQLVSLNEDIHNTENMLLTFRNDLELLLDRERHFESLVEAYEKVTSQLDEKARERRALTAAREADSSSASGDIRPTSSGRPDCHPQEKLMSATEQTRDKHLLEAAEREMQLLQFQQTLLLQDYLIQLEMRPSLIRFTEDLRMKTREAESHLADKVAEKQRVEQSIVANGQGQNSLAVASSLHTAVRPESSKLVSSHDSGLLEKGDNGEELKRVDGKLEKGARLKGEESKSQVARLQSRPQQAPNTTSQSAARDPLKRRRRKSFPSLAHQGSQR